MDYGEFVTILKKMDRNLKNLPATAQVASQQVGLSHMTYILFYMLFTLLSCDLYRESTWEDC